MRLDKIIGTLGLGSVSEGAGEVEITGICIDSRRAGEYESRPGKSGPLFAALPGEHADGVAFAAEAIRNGAACVLSERPAPALDVPVLMVPDVRGALARVSALFYGEPASFMTMVGITGTNGKTTTAYLLESIFKAAGFSTGVVGTVNYRYAGKVLPAPHTTPESPELQRVLAEMRSSGVTHCVIEVSSHALAQKRAEGCAFDSAIFTNLTHEHLDYHHTMEEYFEAKSRLFGMLKENGTAVVNVDDPWGGRLAEGLASAVTYSLKPGASVYPLKYSIAPEGTRAEIATPAGGLTVQSPLVGEYNLSNLLGAVAAATALGVDPEAVRAGAAGLKRVPGRLDKVEARGELRFTAYVDYAHTADALERALCELDRIAKGTGGRIITVFGCGGDRDTSKRPEMGRAAVRHSAITIITSDNPRSEDPLAIIAAIEQGIGGEGVKKYPPGAPPAARNGRGYMVIPDRAEAIKAAVALAGDGDVVLVAGKGHEDYQIVGGTRHHFDDMEALRGAMLSRPGVKELV